MQKKNARLVEVMANLSLVARKLAAIHRGRESWAQDMAEVNLAQVRELERLFPLDEEMGGGA